MEPWDYETLESEKAHKKFAGILRLNVWLIGRIHMHGALKIEVNFP